MKKLVLLFSLFLAFTSQAQDEENPFEAHKAIFMDKPALDFKIIDVMREKNLFEEKNHSIEFAIGLKMFGEVILKNKNLPLFKEFYPAFGDFMKKLKSSNQ